MTDLPDDEPQPGSRAWMQQTAELDSAMATARRYLRAQRPGSPGLQRAGLDGEPVAPTVYPVSDGHSWREGVDAARAGDSGTDADDE
ncbi:MAG TPA: hypothetical protein VFP27_18400, partial [Mycobacterium sp.]|nr:hypothetical protein [Mycobacterium sp.]